ncbi:hypothetical protein AC578_2944 [Pseudocercospora eumusae]|uniref:DUF6604 domain-containing protein n=1 Tax=Pseudocercospora eumusae TaxID=321146 RepID=A0A139HEE7_9PEZI|nr:hypothetical protein AC578_2944 [Pseudocercospora eumusae]
MHFHRHCVFCKFSAIQVKMRYDLYIDSYRRYKRGTAKIAEWLANAGQLCGVDVRAGTKSSPEGRYLMPLSKFSELADAIVTCKEPEMEVKPELLDLLGEVISLRKDASVFYRENSSSNELFERNNEGHLYTIEVLENVLSRLETLKRAQPSAKPTQPAADREEPAGRYSNIFDALDLEDIAEPVVSQELIRSERSQGSQNNARSKTKRRSKDVNSTIELGTSAEELYFTLFCFYKDLHDIQSYIIQIWTEYKAGEVPLVSAAVTTDLAFDIVQRKEYEMLRAECYDETDGRFKTLKEIFSTMHKSRTSSAVPMYFTFEKPGSLLNHGYLGELLFSYVAGDITKGSELPGNPNHADDSRAYQIADWCYMPAYIMLDCAESVSGSAASQGLPTTPSSSFRKTHSASVLQSVKRFGKEFGDFIQITLDMVMIRAAGMDGKVSSDVWTTAIFNLIDPHKPDSKKRMGDRNNRQLRNTMPIWMTFATTVYLDICRLLGPAVGGAFQELQREGKRICSSMEQMLRWCRQHPEPAWTRQHAAMTEDVEHLISQFIEEDIVTRANAVLKVPGGPSNAPHFLIQHNPLWAGIAMFWAQLNLWECSIEMTNIYAMTEHAMHLYALAQIHTQIDWPDMEYLIGLHGQQHLFYGGRPVTILECCKKFALSIGMSAQLSAKDRHNKRHISARGFQLAVRQYRPHAIPSDLFNFRYNVIRMRAGAPEGPQADLPALDLLLEFQKRIKHARLVKSESQSAYVVPLLSRVQTAVAADVKHLSFDLFAMHQRCWNFLQRLRNEMHDDLALINRLTNTALSQADLRATRDMIVTIFNMLELYSEKHGHETPQSRLESRILNSVESTVQDIVMEDGNTGLVTVDNHLVSQKNARSALPRTVAPEDADTESDSDAPSIDPGEFAMLSRALNTHPNRSVTDEEVKEALKLMKKTPLHKMPPELRELFEDGKADGVDLSGGFMAVARNLMRKHSGLTTAQEQELLKTTTLEDHNRLLKTFLAEADGNGRVTEATSKGKKKRNNKNKNKNRKLRQKAQKSQATPATNDGNSNDDEASDDSISNSSGTSLPVGPPLETVSQKPIIGQKHWLTTGPKNEQEWAQFREARRVGKMFIDGEEFTMNFSAQRTLNLDGMSTLQKDALVDLLANLNLRRTM